MILAKMIEKITVTRDYDITIKFYVTPADFYGGNQEVTLSGTADRNVSRGHKINFLKPTFP